MPLSDEQKLELLIKVLKDYAESKHCYDNNPEYEPIFIEDSYNAFDDGIDYGEINFARTLLEQIGEEFEYPCMKEE